MSESNSNESKQIPVAFIGTVPPSYAQGSLNASPINPEKIMKYLGTSFAFITIVALAVWFGLKGEGKKLKADEIVGDQKAPVGVTVVPQSTQAGGQFISYQPTTAAPAPMAQATPAVGGMQTMQMTVASSARIGTRIMLNSQADYKSPQNFTIVLEGAAAAAHTPEEFKGRAVTATGVRGPYVDKAGVSHDQLKVTDPAAIK